MAAFLGPLLGVMGTAADIAGVPGLGVAANILQGIKDNCDRVVAHKVRLRHIVYADD